MIKQLLLVFAFGSTVSLTTTTASLNGEYTGDRKNQVTITFSTNDGVNKGKFPDNSESVAVRVRRGVPWSSVKESIDPILSGSTKYKGQPILNDNYSFGGWLYTEDDGSRTPISDNRCINKDVVFNCKWNVKITDVSFSNASWEQFCQVADDGYDALVTQYSTAYTYAGYNTFIIQRPDDPQEVSLKTRKVQIGANEYNVRVIGENHDYIKGSDKVAALTFEFEDVIEPNISYDYSENEGHQSWGNSTVRNYLNKYLLPEFPSALVAGMKSVVKKVDNGKGENTIVENDERLFLLSREEIQSSKIGDKDDRLLENSYYQYYNTNTATSKKYKTKSYPYWLRSPWMENGKISQAYAMNEDGSISLHSVKEGLGICPTFAVGETQAHTITIRSYVLTSGLADDKVATKYMPIYGKLILDETQYDYPDDLYVTIGGGKAQKGVEYEYNSATGEFSISDTNVINGNIVIAKDKDSNEFEVSKFKTDTWEHLKEVADTGGLNALKKEYDIENFVGKKKSLVYNGKTYWTRVIGQNADNTDTNAKAPLTFEFIDPILTSKYDTTNNHNFINSELNNALNGADGLASKLFSFDLNANTKLVSVYNEEDQAYELDSTNYRPKMFPLSNIELGKESTVGVSDFDEGKTYDYYKDSTPETRTKYLDKKTTTSYWTRSPITNTNKQTYSNFVSSSGEFDSETVNYNENVFPCFTIGSYSVKNKLSFKGYYLRIDEKSEFELDFSEGDKVSFKIVPNDTYRVSKLINVTQKVVDPVTEAVTWEDYNNFIYTPAEDYSSAILTFNSLPGTDIAIYAEGRYNGSSSNWFKTDDIDVTQLVDPDTGKAKEVNNPIVFNDGSGGEATFNFRLIGVDHDEVYIPGAEPGKASKIHTTWEMVEMLNKNGVSAYNPSSIISGGKNGWPYFSYHNYLQNFNAGGFGANFAEANPKLYLELKCAKKTCMISPSRYDKSSFTTMESYDYFSTFAIAEMFPTGSIKKMGFSGDYLDGILAEGTQYDYYKAKYPETIYGDTPFTSITTEGKKWISGGSEWWYTRTLSPVGSSSNCYVCAQGNRMGCSWADFNGNGTIILYI